MRLPLLVASALLSAGVLLSSSAYCADRQPAKRVSPTAALRQLETLGAAKATKVRIVGARATRSLATESPTDEATQLEHKANNSLDRGNRYIHRANGTYIPSPRHDPQGYVDALVSVGGYVGHGTTKHSEAAELLEQAGDLRHQQGQGAEADRLYGRATGIYQVASGNFSTHSMPDLSAEASTNAGRIEAKIGKGQPIARR